MRAFVTGGAGFIGSHLVDRLSSEGYDVYIADNLSTGNFSNLREKPKGVYTSIPEAVNSIPAPDIVVHMGMPSSSPMYKKNPSLVGKVLEEGVLLLEKAKEWGSRFILISTSSLYNGNSIPYREDMSIKVTDFYTEARYSLERLTQLYSKLYGLEAVALRLFSVYGEREEAKGKYANIVSQFMWCFIKDERPIIFGDGTQTRDFIYVGDVVEAILKAIEFEDFENEPYDVFNVSYGVNYTFNDVVDFLQETFDKGMTPVYVENPIKNYVYHTLADTTKARKKLKFKAKTDLKKGIKRIKPYYEALYRKKEVKAEALS